MKKSGFKFLIIITTCLSSTLLTARFCEKIMIKENKRANKNAYLFKNMCKWLKAYQSNKSIIDEFSKRGITEIAIYGMGEVGERLLQELKGKEVEVKYIIDKKKIDREMLMYLPTDELPEVQAIIVTPIFEYQEIVKNLKITGRTEVISLETLLDEINKTL